MKSRDMTGVRSGKLTAIKRAGSRRGAALWECLCECGTTAFVTQSALHCKTTQSCGCSWDGNPTHGMRNSATYKTWSNMLDRCRNPRAKAYKNYGGRGIQVCERWFKFEIFLADMGEKPPNMSIDRINNDGNYEPNNCRWATRRQQGNNMRSNRIIEHNGIRKTLAQWATDLGLLRVTLAGRLRRGVPLHKALQKDNL